MKIQFLTTFAIAITSICFGQTDTICSNNEKISCSIKEITPEAVKFSYPEEDLINSIYKNSIQKIIFKNGRVQMFAEATSFKKVESINDFDNVTITQVEGEVKGLFKIGDVSSKARGTTTLSNQERVKERAYRKIKLQTAMMGANIIYITNQRTEGNKFGGYYQAGSTAETNLTGVSYTNILPSFEEFKKRVSDKKTFDIVLETKLWSGASDYTQTNLQEKFIIHNIRNENGLIMVDGSFNNSKRIATYRIVSYSTESYNIYYEDKSTAYNLKINF